MKKPDSALSAAEMNDRLMRDAGAVIQRRLEIMAEALCDPGGADLTELALMSDEKVAAFTKASQRSAAGAGVVAGRLASAWAAEADIGAKALDQGCLGTELFRKFTRAGYRIGGLGSRHGHQRRHCRRQGNAGQAYW